MQEFWFGVCFVLIPSTFLVAWLVWRAMRAADPKEAEHARERACGADWKAEKAAGKVPAGMTWPKYWSECDKRKKAAGM